MSRKTLLAIIGILGVILTFIQTQFGLGIDVGSICAGLGAIVVYIWLEAKNDLAKMAKQPQKWGDPKFWISFITVILAAINEQFGIHLPVEIIITVLVFIVGLLFKRDLKYPVY